MDNPTPTTPIPVSVSKLLASTPAPEPAAPVLSGAAELMITQFKLLDPNRQAVGLDALRPFYKRVGWNVILATVHELEDAGKLTKKAISNPKGGVGYHVYTWTDA